MIDGRFIGVGDSISRYTLELLQWILNIDKENQYTLLLRPQGEKIAKEFFGKRENLKFRILDIAHYSLEEQTKLKMYLDSERFDLVHFTQFNHPIRYHGKFIVTIHDLTMFGHLHKKDIFKRYGFSAVMKSAIKNSKKIITVSETTKTDLKENYTFDSNKVEVVYLGIDKKFMPSNREKKEEIAEFKKRYGICCDYILYTGMWKKHKNLPRLLKAFEQYFSDEKSDRCLQLVLVGKIDKDEPEVLAEIERINLTHTDFFHGKDTDICEQNFKPIVTTGFIDEKELPIAYAGAFMYCIPSLSEGFGFPPLEAMASGVPVISSNLSAMPEILGEASLYFDPYSIDEIGKAIEKVCEDEKFRTELIAKGLEQSKKYRWDKTAEKTLSIYQEVLKHN